MLFLNVFCNERLKIACLGNRNHHSKIILIIHQASPMESKKTKRIIEGFEADFESISNDFVTDSPELRLEKFFEVWRSKKIDKIFANRFDPRELLESISELNKRLVSILNGKEGQNSETRTVALYFLLCLYVKQPERFRQKIRLTIGDSLQLQNLCQGEKQLRCHSDAQFAWNHLRRLRAIDFVEARLMYGPSMLSHRGSNLSANPDLLSTADDVHRESLDFIDNKIEPALVELQSLNYNYERVKELLELDQTIDATVEFESNGSVTELLDKAKTLVDEYKSDSI